MLESALGDGSKKVESNETQTVVLQRRCVRAAKPLKAGHVLERSDFEVLRPATVGAVPAHEAEKVTGQRINRDLAYGEEIRWTDLGAV